MAFNLSPSNEKYFHKEWGCKRRKELYPDTSLTHWNSFPLARLAITRKSIKGKEASQIRLNKITA